MNLKMPSKDTFGFSDHVMRFCVLVGENIEDYKELTYKKPFLDVSLREDYLALGP